MIHFAVPAAQAGGMAEYLDGWGRDLADRLRIVPYEELPGMAEAPSGTWIFAALDQLGPATLRLLLAFRATIDRPGVRVLNEPGRTLRRLDLLDELHRRGLNRFRAVRATSGLDGLRFPVFLREENRHGGAITPLLDSRGALEAALGRALLRGFRMRDLLVIEFCDTASGEGEYRKYSAFVVGSRIVARSVAVGGAWMLKHRGTEFTRAMVLEEEAYVIGNPHREALRRIFGIAGAGYGRIDYALLDGEVQTWEINLNPTIGRGTRRPSSGSVPAELQPLREITKRHFYDGFRAAFEDLEPAGSATDPIPLRYPPALVRAARAELAARARAGTQTRWRRVRRLVAPLRPVLDPMAAHILPILARVARS